MKILTSFTALFFAICVGLLGPVTFSEFGFEGAQVLAADPPKCVEKLLTSDILVPGGSG